MSSEQLTDSALTLITGAIVAYLSWRGLSERLFGQKGYLFVTAGIALILMGLILDLADDFPRLQRYVFGGHAVYTDYLRWYGGYALGGVLMLVGFAQWVPLIVALRNAERDLTKSNESLLNEILERHQAEEMLAQFREILETTIDFVGIADKQGRLIYVNPAGKRMVGVKEDEDVWDTTISDYHPKWAAALLQQEGFTGAMRDGIWAGEIAFLSRDGREIPVSMVLLAHKSLDGEVEFFSTISRDITEHRTLEELRRSLSRRLLQVQEMERRNVAHELHDEIGQYLTGLTLLLDSVALPSDSSASIRLREGRQLVDELIAKVRDISLSLRPSMLDDLGVVPALKWLTERYSGIQVKFEHNGLEGRRLPPELETAIYRLVQEGLTNIARHAQVTEAGVSARRRGNTVSIRIEDHGTGFDETAVLVPPFAIGLAGMRERVQLLGGKMGIDSAPGKGTHVEIRLPVDAPELVEELPK